MSWLASLLEPDGLVVFRISEVRFTQGAARLHSVGISLAARSQQFSSRQATPHPVDPVSHRSCVSWSDSEIRLPLADASSPITITLTNRRHRLRTVIGRVTVDLASINPPQHGSEPFDRTIAVSSAVSSSLNLKIDLHVELQGTLLAESWRSLLREERGPHEIARRESRASMYGIRVEEAGDHGSVSHLGSRLGSSSAASTIAGLDVGADGSSDHLGPSDHMVPPADGAAAGDTSGSERERLKSSNTSITSMESHETLGSLASSVTSMGMPAAATDMRTTDGLAFNIKPDTLGVVFLEIVSVANLPKFRSLTGISFDMDPFVIMSFGRRVYKTPHRRHTLNPTFNCKVAFDVGSAESAFSIVFSVWDQDKITLNDKVAETELPVSQILERYAPKLDPQTGLFDLEDYAPSSMVLTLNHDVGVAEMLIRVHYYPLAAIRQQMWRGVIGLYNEAPAPGAGALSLDELKAMLNSLGSTLSDEVVKQFFVRHGLDAAEDKLSEDLAVIELERIVNSSPDSAGRIILFRICPICHKDNLGSKRTTPLEHFSLCASRHWAEANSVLLDKRYVSSQQASKRWYSKFLSKFSYGSYQLGAHSANILVQDRISGQISEEKMSTSVRVAIRLTYSLGPVERPRFQRLLRKYTIRQGIKYSDPSSASSIEPFIRFHDLDMSEVKRSVDSFKTFNEFFVRELKPGARPVENADEPRTLVSAADCRLTVFRSVTEATQLWIKGKQFSIERLIGDAYPDDVSRYANEGGLIVFRLAPQDYHRVHSPVDGVVGEAKHIDGHYYTVNPMAIRSTLDVFGENARTVFPIDSPQFGRVMIVMVGAMMVGSCVVTRKAGDSVKRTEELGYFQFGGSTVVALFEKGKVVLDSDVVANSQMKIETLVRVGMSVGHTEAVPEYVRTYDTRMMTIRRARSLISGGGSYLPFSLD